jgi:hypothetical protein
MKMVAICMFIACSLIEVTTVSGVTCGFIRRNESDGGNHWVVKIKLVLPAPDYKRVKEYLKVLLLFYAAGIE